MEILLLLLVPLCVVSTILDKKEFYKAGQWEMRPQTMSKLFAGRGILERYPKQLGVAQFSSSHLPLQSLHFNQGFNTH